MKKTTPRKFQNDYFDKIIYSIVKENIDNRPYIEVDIGGTKVNGLLDSGASCTILGNGSDEIIKKLHLKLYSSGTTVKTADGTKHVPNGYANVPFIFNNKIDVIPCLIVPSITKPLILGMDFWKCFNIKPVVEIGELDIQQKIVECEHNLTPDQQNAFKEVIALFKSSDGCTLGRTHVLKHRIDTNDATPIKQRAYTVSPYIQKRMDEELNRMLNLGVIEPSISPWSNPVVCVKKNTGKLRLCLDSRKLNAVTKRDAYPLPHINRILGRFTNTKFLSKIDLSDAFWQIELTEDSKEKTAFSIPSRGHFQFVVMPFGLHNAPQTQCRLMDRVLGVDLEPSVFVYLDDIIISSGSFDEHIKLLKIVAERLNKAGLTINLNKSCFLKKSIKYLGYIVSEGGLQSDPEKVEAIVNFPIPTNRKEVRRFIGMANWYRRFIHNFAEVASPITDTTKGQTRFK